jgi:hypothetical protein
MAASLPTALRNARGQLIIDAAGDNALLRIYTAAYATLLVELVCDAPLAPGPTGGLTTFNPVSAGVCVASGDAALARLYTAGGLAQVITGLSVGDSASSAQIRLDQTGVALTSGSTITLTSGTIAEGNP